MPVTRTLKMPHYIRVALTERNLMDAYHARPDYQQNDYIGTLCVTRPKRDATRQKRLTQMLDELKGGKLYKHEVASKEVNAVKRPGSQRARSFHSVLCS